MRRRAVSFDCTIICNGCGAEGATIQANEDNRVPAHVLLERVKDEGWYATTSKGKRLHFCSLQCGERYLNETPEQGRFVDPMRRRRT